eukprot:g15925.t1
MPCRTNVVYKITCNDGNKHYIGQIGRKLAIRIHKHQLTAKWHDKLSLISVHLDNEGHQFNWDNVTIPAQANHSMGIPRGLVFNPYAINKHVELSPIYKPMQNRTGNDTNQ